jgi:hypothetical protein
MAAGKGCDDPAITPSKGRKPAVKVDSEGDGVQDACLAVGNRHLLPAIPVTVAVDVDSVAPLAGRRMDVFGRILPSAHVPAGADVAKGKVGQRAGTDNV